LLRHEDADQATAALKSVGFQRETVMDVTMFLDGPDGKPSQAVHVIWAGQKVRKDYVSGAPTPDQSRQISGKQIIDLVELVRMKLTSYRDKDRVHVRDLIGVGLIDESWPSKFEQPLLAERLQALLDDPDG
jgi:hypothetical protein